MRLTNRNVLRTYTRLPILAAATLLLATILVPSAAHGADCPVQPGPVIDVTTCPSPAVPDDFEDDTAAINQAIAQIHGLDGGRVYFPPGTYDAADIKHKSGVELYGPASARIKRLSGYASLIVGEVIESTGTMTKGSPTITGVSSPERFETGAVVAVLGAAGGSSAQRTKLYAPVMAGGGMVIVTNGDGFSRGGNWIRIDNEIIKYSSQSGSRNTMLNGVYRGRLGTTSAAHAGGAIVWQLQTLYARVLSVSGTSVTLDRPSNLTVRGTEVFSGSMNMAVTGLTLDGNRANSTANTYPLKYELARGVTVTGNTIVGGDHGGIRLARGTTEALVENNVLLDNGNVAEGMGAAVWLFQQAEQNIVWNNQIGSDTDSSFVGVFIDDRSDGSTEWDGPSNGNRVEGNTVKMRRMGTQQNYGIAIQGGTSNTISGNDVYYPFDGIRVHNSPQGSLPRQSLQNTVTDNRLIQNANYALTVNGKQNTLTANAVSASGGNCKDYTSPLQNTWSGNTTDDGTACPTAPASSPSTPPPLIDLGGLFP